MSPRRVNDRVRAVFVIMADMRTGIIYCATTPSGKQYVGQTVQALAARRAQHYSDARRGKETPLARALRKYGAAVEWEVIAEPPVSCLNEYEQFHIAYRGTRAPAGLNSTAGGDKPPSAKGRKLSPKARQNIARGKRGKNNPMKRPEVVAKNKRARKLGGKPFHKHTEAEKEARRAQRREYYRDPENRRRQSERMTAWWAQRTLADRAAHAGKTRRHNMANPVARDPETGRFVGRAND